MRLEFAAKNRHFCLQIFPLSSWTVLGQIIAEPIFKKEKKTEETKCVHQLKLIAPENTSVCELSSPAAETEKKAISCAPVLFFINV